MAMWVLEDSMCIGKSLGSDIFCFFRVCRWRSAENVLLSGLGNPARVLLVLARASYEADFPLPSRIVQARLLFGRRGEEFCAMFFLEMILLNHFTNAYTNEAKCNFNCLFLLLCGDSIRVDCTLNSGCICVYIST